MLFRLFSYITLGGYMKIERINLRHFLIFFNSFYLEDIEFTKDSIVKTVKLLLEKLKDKLLLRGFYKVKVYVHRKVGLFLDLLQVEEFEYDNSLDFRVVVFLDEKIYFKTSDYFVLPRNVSIYTDKNNFYCDVDDIIDVLSILEFGDFIYGDSLYSVMKHWRKC